MTESIESLIRARVLLRVPGMESVILRPDVPYREVDGRTQTLDVRYPVSARRGAVPAVVFVNGFPDLDFPAAGGYRLKDMQPLVSWAELAAACGLAAVTYAGAEPAADVHAVLDFLEQHPELRIDPEHIGLWASSGNVPNALSLLLSERGKRLRCAVLCYGFMLDEPGGHAVADAAEAWRFVNPCSGRTAAELPDDTPVFVARAGRDEFAGLNASIDRFVADALANNKPITVTNLRDAPHAFDLFYNEDPTREAVRCILTFLRFHLLGL